MLTTGYFSPGKIVLLADVLAVDISYAETLAGSAVCIRRWGPNDTASVIPFAWSDGGAGRSEGGGEGSVAGTGGACGWFPGLPTLRPGPGAVTDCGTRYGQAYAGVWGTTLMGHRSGTFCENRPGLALKPEHGKTRVVEHLPRRAAGA